MRDFLNQMSRVALALAGVLLLLCSARAQTSLQCHGQQNGTAASSLACSGSLVLQVGDVVTETFQASFSTGGNTASLTGAALNQSWVNGTSAGAWTWIVTSAGTVTPSVSYVGGSQTGNALLNVAVWRGFAVYPVAMPLKGYESDASPQSQTGITVPNGDPNDTIVSMMIETCSSCSSQTSSFTLDSATVLTPSFSSGTPIGMQMMYKNGATNAGGPYSNSIGVAGLGNMWSYSLVLRKLMPAIGTIQAVGATQTTGSSISATLPLKSRPGGFLRGVLIDTSGQISTLTASGGVSCYMAADTANATQWTRNFWCPVPTPAPSSPVTITATPISGSFGGDLLVTECIGCSISRPLAASSNNILTGGGGATPSTTQTVLPMYLQSKSTFYLDGFTEFSLGSATTEQKLATPSAPFALLYQFERNHLLLSFYGAAIETTSAPQSQGMTVATDFTIAPSSAAYAWASQPSAFPTVIEGFATCGGCGAITTFTDPETDAGVYFCGVSPNSGTWSLTASWTSLTTIDGCASSSFCIAYTTVPPPIGATLVITSAPSFAFAQVEKVRALGTLDHHSVSTPGSGGSVGPVTATATGSNEVARLCAGDEGTGTGTYTMPSFDSGTNGSNDAPNLSDNGEVTTSEAFLLTSGTYGASWATAPGLPTPGTVFGDTATFFTSIIPSAPGVTGTRGGGAVHAGKQATQ